MNTSIWDAHSISTLGSLLFASKNSFHASFCLLIYDHIITLDQEASRIWSQPWNAHKALFLLNRYISPSQFLIQLLTLDLPAFSGKACLKIYRLPYASALYSTALAELILILRTYALYGLSKKILLFLAIVFFGHVTIMSLATINAHRYTLPEGFVACTLTAQGLTNVFFWAAPFIADTIIFFMTLWKTASVRRSVGRSGIRIPLLTVLARDGILYYFVILAIDTVNLAIYLFTTKSIKPMGGAFCQVLTTVMINRLQLNLRSPLITHNRPTHSSITELRGDNNLDPTCTCKCGKSTPFHIVSAPRRLDSIHSIVISQVQSLPMFGESMATSVGSQVCETDTSVNNSKCPRCPQRSGGRSESQSHLSGSQTPGTGHSEEHKHCDAETGLDSTITPTSTISFAPSWWFDRQVLSLGGVCENEPEDETYHSEYDSQITTPNEDTNGDSNRPSRLNTNISPSCSRGLSTSEPSSSRYFSATTTSSSSSSSIFASTPTSPDRPHRSSNYSRFSRSINPTQSQIPTIPIHEGPECEQVELEDFRN